MIGTSKMLTVADVCERLNVHEATVRRWIKAGTLKGSLLGGTVWRIPESEVERLIAEGSPPWPADTDTRRTAEEHRDTK